MAKGRKGDPPEAAQMVEEVGVAAAKVLSREVAPVAEEVKRQAAVGAREVAVLAAAGVAGFLAVQLTLWAAVESLGRRIGRPTAALVTAGALAATAAGGLRLARRDRPRAPLRFILERLAAAFRSRAAQTA